MTAQIILKLGGLCPNKTAVEAGFKIARRTGFDMHAIYLEDQDLIKATRLACTSEIRGSGSKRCLEIHELKRELRIGTRSFKKDILRRSRQANLNVEFEFIEDNELEQFGTKCNGAELIVLGEQGSPRLLWQEVLRLLEIVPNKKVLVAGRHAKNSDGPITVLVSSLAEWSCVSSMFMEVVANNQETPVIFAVGETMEKADALISDIQATLDAEGIEFQPTLENNRARVTRQIAQLYAGPLLICANGPFAMQKRDIETLINVATCPLLISA